jgi:hypothetical protein
MQDNTGKSVDDGELNEALKAAETGEPYYTHTFRKPFDWEGKTYTKLEFDFGRLTGRDARAIEEELLLKNKAVIVPAMSGEYLMCMAARSSRIGLDAFDAMPIADYNRIRARARSFLLNSEL